MQPGPRERPSALQRGRRQAQRRGSVLDPEARKESQFDDARLLGIELLEAGKRLVQRRQHVVRGRTGIDRLVQRHAIQRRPSLRRTARSGTIHQHLPHGARRDRDEVTAVLPRGTGMCQSQVRLVDQSGRLQRLAGRFASHVRGGDPTELVVDIR